MKNVLTAGAALLMTTTLGHAAGIDRSGQPVGLIFEDGNVAELSFGYVSPSLSGEVANPFFGPLDGAESGNMAGSYTQLGGGFKVQQTDNFSYALIVDQPYGAAVNYEEAGYPVAGTEANVTSYGLTGLVRYEINPNFSVHAGLRAVTVEGDYTLVSGGTPVYASVYSSDTATGYVAGVAYERDDIALRVALTYSSEIEFDLDGTVGDLNTTMPESVNLDFQSGIAADTLLFGSVRYAAWDGVSLDDNVYGPLISYDNDGYTYTLGVGRRFSDVLSGSVSVGYEAATDELAGNLAPSDGYVSLAVGAAYQLADNVELSGGMRYVSLGDAETDLSAAVPGNDTVFADNSAVAFGMKIAYSF